MRDFPPPWADDPTLRRRAEDLADAYGISITNAVAFLQLALAPEVAGIQPIGRGGIAVDYRWWERPRRLWRRHAAERTLHEIRAEFGPIEIPVKRLPGDSR